MSEIRCVDMFAGCGGFSTGLADACREAGVPLRALQGGAA
jgi:site-specific DNA-cytosine methylase